MNWEAVGAWIKDNAGTGAAVVGSLLTGNVPAAVAAGVGLVASATGSTQPDAALSALQSDPEAMIRLKSLFYQNEADIRRHIEAVTLAELDAETATHSEGQKTIRAGDTATDRIVRLTRPSHASASLIAAIVYVFTNPSPNENLVMLLLALPFGYAGLRQIGKGIDSITARPILSDDKKVRG